MELPEWHEVSDRYSAAQVINLQAVAQLDDAPEYAALRSYATGRRQHRVYGPMPQPVARIANRRLWLLTDIAQWLTVPIPQWRRNSRAVKRWIADGRPRPEATLAGSDGSLQGTDGAGDQAMRADSAHAGSPGASSGGGPDLAPLPGLPSRGDRGAPPRLRSDAAPS